MPRTRQSSLSPGADERRAVRMEKIKPLVLALKTWLEEQLARVSAKSVIAEAIR
jgi:transposase